MPCSYDGGGRRFADYVADNRPDLLRQAFVLCGDWHEAEDLVQEALIKICRRWPVASRSNSLRSYSRTVLLRTFLNSRRGLRWRREILSADPPDICAPTPDSSTESYVTLVSAMRKLGRAQRATILLRFWEDRPVDEVARLLGVPAGTVTSHTHRALATLRNVLMDPQ